MNGPPNPPPEPGSRESAAGPARFSANATWLKAMAMIAANRETLVVLAGVFFLLPQMITAFAMPEPPVGLEGDAQQEAIAQMYATWWPLMLAAVIVQGIGLLSVMALFTHGDRPTVAEALRRGIFSLPSYIAAQLIVAAGVGVLMLIVLVPFAAAGESALALALIPAGVLAFWIFVRTMITAPVIVAERQRNPFEALRRSWRLTGGHGWRLFIFLLLLVIAAIVIATVATAVPGAVLIPLTGAETAAIFVAVVGSIISAAMTLIAITVITAIYLQLSGRARR